MCKARIFDVKIDTELEFVAHDYHSVAKNKVYQSALLGIPAMIASCDTQ